MGRSKRTTVYGTQYSALIFLFLLFSAKAQSFNYDSLFGSETPLRNFNVTYYHLDVNIDPDLKSIKGSNQICFTKRPDQYHIQLELDSRFKVERISQKKIDLPFTHDSLRILVSLPFDDTAQCLTLHYSGKPIEANHAPWDGGVVWSKDSLGRKWSGAAIQNDGAYLWWPCKDSWYDKPDSMRITLRGLGKYRLVSNGQLVSESKNGKQYISEWKVSYPILPYNVTFYQGKYSNFSIPMNGKLLHYFPLHQNKSKATKHFLQCNTILEKYSDLFGEYPFHNDGFKVVEAPYWGMEHQTAVAYGNHYRNDVMGYDFILLHEIAHEWWGNHISATDPAYMWIHEAMATYSEALFFEKVYNKEQSIRYLMHQKKNIENKKIIEGVPNCRYHDYPDADMYYRGTWMMHTLRHHLNNDSMWFQMLKKIHTPGMPTQYSGKEFQQYISSFLQIPLDAFFDYFIRSTETPELHYRKNGIQLELKWKSIPPFSIWHEDQKILITETFTPCRLTDEEVISLQKYYYLNLISE